MTNTQEISKRAAGEAALQYVQDGDLVGLGTGSTVKYFLLALGEKVKSGFRVQGIPSSLETARIAHGLHIPLLPYEGEWKLDVAVDGADQVDPQFQLIKGGGGALLREKIVASRPSIHCHCRPGQIRSGFRRDYASTCRGHTLWMAKCTTTNSSTGLVFAP